MKRAFSVIPVLLLVCLLFTSCTEKQANREIEDISDKVVVYGGSKDDKVLDEIKDDTADAKEPEEQTSKSLEDIRNEIISSIGAEDAAPLDADSASAIYGVDTADISQAAGFVVMAGTFPHEIIMIQAVSEEAASEVAELFETKLDAFTQQSKGYDAHNYALAQKCKVERNGNFVALFLSPDCEKIKGIYSKYIK